ncbi:MAG: polysaccharide biosynthesis protein [Gammaproteobacteria bacterium]|nr:polysaccharide biosynthesis protein [Gammaproteobacteria bacterium]
MSKIEETPEKVVEDDMLEDSLDFELDDDLGADPEPQRVVPTLSSHDESVANSGAASTAGTSLQLRSTSSSGDIAKMEYKRCLTADELDAKKIIHPDMKSREAFNTFRELRTKLLKISQGDNFIVMVSSVVPKGGASFFSLNLASAFAFDESKTALLIECNLRSPCQHDVLEVDSDVGLRDYLADAVVDLEEIICDSGIERLRLCPAGRNREVFKEFFTTDRMREFIELVRRRYSDRFIFIDAPSVDDTDAQILAELSDYVLLVVPYGGVEEAQITDAIDVMGEEKVVGLVLNNIP